LLVQGRGQGQGLVVQGRGQGLVVRGQGLVVQGRGQGQGLENLSSGILDDKDFPQGQQHCQFCMSRDMADVITCASLGVD